MLQGFGTGNIAVNQELLATLDELYARGCVPILTTQVTFGGIDQRYAISAWTKTAKLSSVMLIAMQISMQKPFKSI